MHSYLGLLAVLLECHWETYQGVTWPIDRPFRCLYGMLPEVTDRPFKCLYGCYPVVLTDLLGCYWGFVWMFNWVYWLILQGFL